jgi:HAMP domain-containing protein/putative methionine-R-sulfoxide reductase with GAF domain
MLATYKTAFHKNVEINEVIGLNHNKGLKGDIRNIVHDVEGAFNSLHASVKKQTENKKTSLLQIFLVLFIIEILVAVFIALRFSKMLLGAIQKIKTAMNALSSGEYPENVEITSGDELQDVGENLNELRDRISTAAEFSKEIGTGNLEIEYEDKFSNDVLAKAIIDMREKLKVNADDERERAWHTEGIAKFGGILQEEKDDLNALCKILVSHLCSYLDTNQAGIFVINDENPKEEFLELSGAYAYDRDKHLEMQVKKGEGLVGQCWLEKKRIFMTDVPSSYVNITSGLGESSPSCIIILPLPYNEDILGVLEMASFKVLSEVEIGFLEDLAKNIAATLSGVRIASRTKHLLEESKIMQESLQAQEEEMRQNMEEMQATQDMMDEKENESNGKIKELEKQLRALNQKND